MKTVANCDNSLELQPTGIVEMLNAHDGIGPFGLRQDKIKSLENPDIGDEFSVIEDIPPSPKPASYFLWSL